MPHFGPPFFNTFFSCPPFSRLFCLCVPAVAATKVPISDSPFVFGNITTTTTSASLSSSNAGDDHDEIDAYIRTDGSGGLFWCAVCDKKTRFKNSIRRHIEGIHFSRTYTCELCQEVFKARYMLTRHIAKYHN